MIDPAFIVNSIVDDRGRVEQAFAGDWRAAHGRACEVYTSSHARRILEKRELIIVSCGGSPYDINMIQAHKALDMAAHACADGGLIVLLAECGDGLGRHWTQPRLSAGIRKPQVGHSRMKVPLHRYSRGRASWRNSGNWIEPPNLDSVKRGRT